MTTKQAPAGTPAVVKIGDNVVPPSYTSVGLSPRGDAKAKAAEFKKELAEHAEAGRLPRQGRSRRR